MVHGGINIYRLKDNATRTVLVRVVFYTKACNKGCQWRIRRGLLLCISEILLVKYGLPVV